MSIKRRAEALGKDVEEAKEALLAWLNTFPEIERKMLVNYITKEIYGSVGWNASEQMGNLFSVMFRIMEGSSKKADKLTELLSEKAVDVNKLKGVMFGED